MVIKDYLGHKDLPMHNPIEPVDSYLNVVLSLDKKKVSLIFIELCWAKTITSL